MTRFRLQLTNQDLYDHNPGDRNVGFEFTTEEITDQAQFWKGVALFLHTVMLEEEKATVFELNKRLEDDEHE